MATFETRLRKYKKEDDYFLVDICKSGTWETIHDLTWEEAKKIMASAKKNRKVETVDILVEDWDAEDEFLFKSVKHLEKTPSRWKINLDTWEVQAIEWK